MRNLHLNLASALVLIFFTACQREPQPVASPARRNVPAASNMLDTQQIPPSETTVHVPALSPSGINEQATTSAPNLSAPDTSQADALAGEITPRVEAARELAPVGAPEPSNTAANSTRTRSTMSPPRNPGVNVNTSTSSVPTGALPEYVRQSNAQNPGPTDTNLPGAGSQLEFPIGNGDTGGSDTGIPTRAGTGNTTGNPTTGMPPPQHAPVTERAR